MNEQALRAVGRLWGFVLLTVAIGGLLVWRWHNLQVSRFGYYSQLAHDNQLSILPVEPPRGRIFDRNGEPLAVNEIVYSLKVGSDFADEVLGKLDVIERVVRISEDAVEHLREAKDSSIYRGIITLRDNLTEQEVTDFVSWQFLFPEIILESELARHYPKKDSAGHVIGYVGRLTERDFTQLKSDDKEGKYRGAKFIGKTGVELIYEDILRGDLGVQDAQVDAHGRIYRRAVRRSPQKGRDIYLTVDMRLQRHAESLLAGESGAAVIMNVRDGALLVLASNPRFDSNHFVFGISSSRWKALNDSSQKPLIHRAIYGQYAPGSTIKPFFALAALHNGWRDEDYIYQSRGFFQLGTRRFHDWKKGGHGDVDISRSIVRSVNSFYYELGHEIGIDRMHDGLAVFGFGKKSGIDLDNEKNGILPTAAWKQKTYNQVWFPGETISSSVGQGYVQATPLQMAVAMSMIANGGTRLRPYVYLGGAKNTQEFSPAHLQLVHEALAAVTQPGGTAPDVGLGAEYGIAGKTGTAQVSRLQHDEEGERIKNEDLPKNLRDHAWFVGYAPAESPEVAIAVIVENGGSGGKVAGPIVRQLIDSYWQYYAPPLHEEIDEAELEIILDGDGTEIVLDGDGTEATDV